MILTKPFFFFFFISLNVSAIEIIENKTFTSGLELQDKTGIIIRNCIIRNRDGNFGIKLTNCKNILIENCFVNGISNESKLSLNNAYSKKAGFRFLPLGSSYQAIVLNNCKSAVIRNCDITDCLGQGIKISGDNNILTSDILIENNRIAYMGNDGIKFVVDQDQYKPKDVMPFKGGIIRNNIIHDIGLGISHNGYACHGMYVKAADVLIEGNTIFNCFFGEGISLRNSGIIRNNNVSNCARACIAFWAQTNTSDSKKEVIIEENDCHQDYSIVFPMRHILDSTHTLNHLPLAVIILTINTNATYNEIKNYVVKNNKCVIGADYNEKTNIPILRFTNDYDEFDSANKKNIRVNVSGNMLIDKRTTKNYQMNVPISQTNNKLE